MANKIKQKTNQRQRLDKLLVEKKLLEDGYTDLTLQALDKAKRFVMAGLVEVDGQIIDKPGTQIPIDSEITLKEISRYVSRGGLKLEAALKHFSIDVSGKIAIDVGASTGGFTDCLLQHGAKFVYALDVGYGQLTWKLRQDERVLPVERTNIRYVKPNRFDKPIEIAVIDVAFISLKTVLPAVAKLLVPNGEIIALIKPNFEALRKEVEPGGVITDPRIHRRIVSEISDFASQINLKPIGVCESPIRGAASGNIEYLIYLILGKNYILDK